MTWTHFYDMHSGGDCKEPPYQHIYIEASEAEARVIFYNRFGHSPDRVTCTCCGEDYSLAEKPTLEEVSSYWRKEHGNRQSVQEHIESEIVLAIAAEDIKPEERSGDVPAQGYVWMD